MDKKIKTLYRWMLIISVESLFFIIWLAILPKDSGSAALLGLSFRRLLMVIIIILGGLGILFLAILLKRNPQWQNWLENKENQNKFYLRFLPVSFLITLAAWCFAFLYPILNLQLISNDSYIRLLPVITWIGTIALQGFIILPLLFLNKNSKYQKINIWQEKSFLIILVLFLSVFTLIALTKIGFNPPYFAINDLAVPLLEGQIWFLIGIVFLVLWLKIVLKQITGEEKLSNWVKRYDWIFLGLLWIVAVVFWMSQPLPQFNYFAPRVLPPNYQTYPFSDAQQYDFDAYKVIFGVTSGSVISKPLYISFLAALHLIGGDDYATIILLQTLILAFIPVVIYLIGREVNSRSVGIAAGLLFILRELTSIQAVDFANVSNSKLLLSEMLATLLICIFILIVIKWIKKGNKQPEIGLIIGGVIGLIALIRIQALVFIPLIVILSIMISLHDRKRLIFFNGYFFASCFLVLLPILISTYIKFGTFWFEQPVEAQNLLWISGSSNSISSQISAFTSTIAEYFSRNLISSILIFPARINQPIDLKSFFFVKQAFWAQVPENPGIFNYLVITLNIVIISLGCSKIWQKSKTCFIALIGFFIVYTLSNAMTRLAGWRFMLPIDWLVLVIYSLGFVSILRVILDRIWGHETEHFNKNNTALKAQEFSNRTPIIWLALFILISSIIPLRELLIPPVIKVEPKEQLCRTVSNSDAFLSSGLDLNIFMADCLAKDTQVMNGIGFYPRFFESGFGLRNDPKDIYYGPQDQARLFFRFIGTSAAKVIIPLPNPPSFFPNESSVIMIGQWETDVNNEGFFAKYVLVEKEGNIAFIQATP